jgi:type I restriction enzyme S subunit
LNKESLRSVAVYLPSDPEEQRAIAQVLAEMDAEIDAIVSRLTKTRALKQAMAQGLLTARIRLAQADTP